MNTLSETTLTVRSVAAMHRLAARLAAHHAAGGVLALHGDLGCGKTTFTQGLAHALGVRDIVTSPTFTLINEYPAATLRLVHMDLYRIQSPADLDTLDFEAILESPATLTVIEWPERAGVPLPPETTHVFFEGGVRPSERRIRIRSRHPIDP